MALFRIASFSPLAVGIMACTAVPGGEGDLCNKHGLCGPGVICGPDNFCVKQSSLECAPGFEGLCFDTNADCGWFVGPDDLSPAGEMCEVPAGTYRIGESANEVSLESAVYVDRFEVTNARYKLFYDSDQKDANRPVCNPGDKTWNTAPPYFPQDREDHPVVCVNRAQAAAYCLWAGKRLPRGIEWEAASRGDDGRSYPWGEDSPAGLANCQNTAGTPGDYCNETYPPNTCTDGATATVCPDTAPIYDVDGAVTLPDGASVFGHLHTSGNVWEWVSDAAGNDGIIRGGSWADFFGELEVWSELAVSPESYEKTTVGFRCAH